jgi:two-component sensor histidine kinase
VRVAEAAPEGTAFLVTGRPAGSPPCRVGSDAASLAADGLSPLRPGEQAPLVGADAKGLILAQALQGEVGGLVALRRPFAQLLHGEGAMQAAAWLLRPGGAPALPLSKAARSLPAPDLPFTTVAMVRQMEQHHLAVGPLAPGLALALSRPSGPEMSLRWRRAAVDLLQIAALLGFCLAAVALGARYTVVQPLQRLHAAVRRWRAGDGFEPGHVADMPAELRELTEAFRRAAGTLAAQEQELRASLESRELLMAEVHHRVKNNLQVVSSLLNLQAQRILDMGARAEFEAARDRVQALATLHRHLYAHHDHETIDLAAFIGELGGQLFAAAGERPGQRIALDVAAPALRISSDQAVPLALIITEAVTNALKYAFPAGRRGSIEIRVTAGERHAQLTVRDDGVGHAGAAAPDRPGLGSQLLRALARQLGGSLAEEEGPGTALRLDFPLRPPVARPPPALRPRAPAEPSSPA